MELNQQNRILKYLNQSSKSEFDIKEDTYAAVYSAVDEGTPLLLILLVQVLIVLTMMGKGNSKVDSLGYVLWIMQVVIIMVNIYRAYYFNKMPENLRDEFAKNYDLTPNTIKNKLIEKKIQYLFS